MASRTPENSKYSLSSSSINSHTSVFEHKLFSRLQTALSKTVDKYTASLRFSRFKEKYRKIYEADPDNLRIFHEQLCTQMSHIMKEDLDRLCKEKNMDFHITFLENLIQKHQNNVNSEAWRPSGDAKEDLRDHIFAVKLKHKELLEQQLNRISSENEELNNIIIATENENTSLQNYIQSAMDDLKKIFDIYNQPEFAIVEEKLHDILGSEACAAYTDNL